MKEKYYIKFHNYLKDVVKHFQETGSLRNFSELSNKHKCTKITVPLFYEYGLHLLDGEPSRKVSDTIRDRISDDSRKQRGVEVKSTRFKKGDIIAWYNESGYECIAVVGDEDYFDYCLNYEKKGEVFVCDPIPDDAVFVKPSYDGLMSITSHIVQAEQYYRKMDEERMGKLF